MSTSPALLPLRTATHPRRRLLRGRSSILPTPSGRTEQRRTRPRHGEPHGSTERATIPTTSIIRAGTKRIPCSFQTGSAEMPEPYSGTLTTLQYLPSIYGLQTGYKARQSTLQQKPSQHRAVQHIPTFYIYEFKTGSDWGHTTNTSFATLNTDQYREYSGTNTLTSERHLGTQNGVSPGSSNTYKTAIQRIWVT